MSISSHEYVYISISAGNYLYSYIIIPASINHNTLYTITNDYKSSVCCFTHMHTEISYMKIKQIFRRVHNNKRQYFI